MMLHITVGFFYLSFMDSTGAEKNDEKNHFKLKESQESAVNQKII